MTEVRTVGQLTDRVTWFNTPEQHVVVERVNTLITPDPGPVWKELQLDWENYDNQLEKKALCRDMGQYPNKLRYLFKTLMRPSSTSLWIWDFAKLLGIDPEKLVSDETLHGGGLHVVRSGGHLGVHVDYALHPKLDPPMERRLNMILFLVPRWEESWGGALQFYDDEGREVVHSVYPAPYRAVLWANTDTAFHGTQLVSADCLVPRLSANIYYVSPARLGVNRKRALFIPNRN